MKLRNDQTGRIAAPPRLDSWRRRIGLLSLLLGAAGVSGCSSGNPAAPIPGEAETDGTIVLTGVFVPEDGLSSRGRASIVEDETDTRFLALSNDFRTDLSAGTVHVYLAQTDENLAEQRDADPNSISGLIGRINENGPQRFALPEGTDPALRPYVILWCEPEGINFASCYLTEAP